MNDGRLIIGADRGRDLVAPTGERYHSAIRDSDLPRDASLQGAHMAHDNASNDVIRLADILAALSQVSDLGMGFPPLVALRTCLLGTALARELGLSEPILSDVFYTSLLKYIGCTACAYEDARIVGGDDIAMRASASRRDLNDPREVAGFLTSLAPAANPVQRSKVVLLALARLPAHGPYAFGAQAEAAAVTARRLGLSPAVQASLRQVFEQWGGKGLPNKLAGEAIALPARIAYVAGKGALLAALYGEEEALAAIRRMAGGALDPELAATFARRGPDFFAASAEVDPWQAVVDAEPGAPRLVAAPELDGVARAFADLADLKSPWFSGHSPGVAALAADAANTLGLPAAARRDLRLAALLHDLGRIGVPNGIWDKPGDLTRAEWEQVRLHPYHTERILACSPTLAPIADVAGMHHERLDGSGYYRHLTAAQQPMPARILAAADAFQAMTQARPYRAARPPEVAATVLQTEANEGRLDHDAVHAVLTVAGTPRPPVKRARPANLSDREVEVLRLIASGASYREIAARLSITPKTAEHHIEHVYQKIKVSGRAPAALFAMEHNLLTAPDMG